METYFENLLKTVFFLVSKYEYFMGLAHKHQSHEPHNRLIFSFVQLFKHAQKKINLFQNRHLDLYYRKLLGLKPKPAQKDRTFLQFRLEEDIKKFDIKSGTAFLAGTDDDGEDIKYVTKEDLHLNQCAISQIKGVFVGRDENAIDPIIGPVTQILSRDYSLDPVDQPWSILNIGLDDPNDSAPAEIGFAISSPNLELLEGERTITIDIGNIKFHCLRPEILEAIKEANYQTDKKESEFTLKRIIHNSPFDLEDKVTISEFLNRAFISGVKPSEICIHSSFINQVLINQEVTQLLIGEETEQVHPDTSIDELYKFLDEKCALNSDAIMEEARLAMLTNLPTEKTDESQGEDYQYRKFRRIFMEALEISYSKSEGWEYIKPVSVELATPSKSEYNLRIVLSINHDGAPVQCNEASGYDEPTIRFLLNHEAHYYAYDFLNQIWPSWINCHVDVKEVKNLALYNHMGQLNPDGPFLPFGPTPNTYSYILIGNKELFRKQFSGLSLNVEWMDLPDDRGGFKAYYSMYDEEYENDLFETEVSILSMGSWFPKKGNRQAITLFKGNPFLEEVASYGLDIARMDVNADFKWNPQDLVFDKLSKRGFIKLQLSSPSHSFGHDQYPNLLSRMVMQNAKKLTSILSIFAKKDTPLNLPKQPYTPKISRVSLNYDVSFTLDFRAKVKKEKIRKNKFFHLEPFGGFKHITETEGSVQLLANHTFEGCLHIGLKNCKTPETMTLFFHLIEQEVEQDLLNDQGIVWSLLSNNEWKELGPHQVPSDTTNGLIHSGIVRLEIPRIDTTGNGPATFDWTVS